MALPTTIFAIAAMKGYSPPFKSSAGNFYVVARGASGQIKVWKATDPTDSWSDVTDGVIGSASSLTAVQDGDILHISKELSGNYHYTTFDMSDDTTGVSSEFIESPTNVATNPWISIAVRSDGDVVVVYAGDTDQNMGGKKERVDVNIRTGGTWGGPVSLDAGGDVHYGNPNCVLGTNDFVHCYWQRQTGTADDPPTSWGNSQGRSIDPSDDSLSTTDDSTGSSANRLLGMPNIISYDDGGTQQVNTNTFNDTGVMNNIIGIEDANDEIQVPASASAEVTVAEGYANGEVGISTFASLTSDIHCLYSGGGADGVDQDLYYTKSTDNGLNWDTETEEIDAITVNFISTNIYVRGADTVLAYVYDDAGAQKYNEKVLIAGAVALIAPPLLRSFATIRASNY